MSSTLQHNLSKIDELVKKFITDIVKDSYKDDKDIYLKTYYDTQQYIISFLSMKTGNVIATAMPKV